MLIMGCRSPSSEHHGPRTPCDFRPTNDVEACLILGEVVHQGVYPHIEGMTIETAIAAAGGVTSEADLSQMIVFQRSCINTFDIVKATPAWSRVSSLNEGDVLFIPRRKNKK